MKYLCLAYYDPSQYAAMTPAQLEKWESDCKKQDPVFLATGKVSSVASLADPAVTKVLRPKGGKVTVTDGPYIEAREQLGSFFIIEAKDLQEAVEIASRHPGAVCPTDDMRGGIEVRPIEYFAEPTRNA